MNNAVDDKQNNKHIFGEHGEDNKLNGVHEDTGTNERETSLLNIFRLTTIGAGLQFGWALQLSLLTPYVQELGIPHTFASYIWLCGPISGMFVQPIVGYYSDACRSRFGRRRPFVVGGYAFIVLAVLLVGFSSDLGHLMGDNINSTRKTWAIVLYVSGFWLLDLANNTVQGPLRALLGDLTGSEHRKTRIANAFFSFFLAVGNVLGYATGAYSGWYKLFKFTRTTACSKTCANLKSAFILDIIILTSTTVFSITGIKEIPLKKKKKGQEADVETGKVVSAGHDDNRMFIWEMFTAIKVVPRPVWFIFLVTALSWIAWFPWLLYDTDWVGSDIYRGDASSKNQSQKDLYDRGVRMGSFGLMLYAVMLGVTSLLMETLCRRFGAKYVWGVANLILSSSLAGLVGITYAAKKGSTPPSHGIVAAILVLFALIGIPQAVTYSLPFALVSSFANSYEGGQGLSMGVLNQAVVIPQLLVSFTIGPFDRAFGGSNVPGFILGCVVAFIAAVVAILKLPTPPSHINKPEEPNLELNGISHNKTVDGKDSRVY